MSNENGTTHRAIDQQLRQKAISGTIWTIGGISFSRFLRLLNHLVLAWLLAPEIFGIMSLVRIFIQGLEMFSDMGINASIVRSPRGHDPVFLNTAWTLQATRGVTLWLFCCILAYPYAWFYGQNSVDAWQLMYLLPVAGLTSLISGFQSTSLATFNKALMQKQLTLLDITKQVVTLSSIVVWAIISPSVWAMVGGSIIGAVASLIIGHRLEPERRVRFLWDRSSLIELLGFGKWIFLSTILSFLAMNIDKLTLGMTVSISELGVYGIAFVFSQFVFDITMQISNSVMFPVYSSLQSNPNQMMRIAIKMRKSILILGGCGCFCFAVCSPLLFETLWDQRYHEAGTIAQWLTIYMWNRILLSSMDRVPVALGNSRALFTSNIIQLLGIIPAASLFLIYGLPGFIVGLSLGPLCAHILLVQSLPIRRKDIYHQTIQSTLVTLATTFLAIVVTSIIREHIGFIAWLVTLAMLCVAAISFMLYASHDDLISRNNISIKRAFSSQKPVS